MSHYSSRYRDRPSKSNRRDCDYSKIDNRDDHKRDSSRSRVRRVRFDSRDRSHSRKRHRKHYRHDKYSDYSHNKDESFSRNRRTDDRRNEHRHDSRDRRENEHCKRSSTSYYSRNKYDSRSYADRDYSDSDSDRYDRLKLPRDSARRRDVGSFRKSASTNSVEIIRANITISDGLPWLRSRMDLNYPEIRKLTTLYAIDYSTKINIVKKSYLPSHLEINRDLICEISTGARDPEYSLGAVEMRVNDIIATFHVVTDDFPIKEDGLVGVPYLESWIAMYGETFPHRHLGIVTVPANTQQLMCIRVINEIPEGYVPLETVVTGVHYGDTVVKNQSGTAYLYVTNTTKESVDVVVPCIGLIPLETLNSLSKYNTSTKIDALDETKNVISKEPRDLEITRCEDVNCLRYANVANPSTTESDSSTWIAPVTDSGLWWDEEGTSWDDPAEQPSYQLYEEKYLHAVDPSQSLLLANSRSFLPVTQEIDSSTDPVDDDLISELTESKIATIASGSLASDPFNCGHKKMLHHSRKRTRSYNDTGDYLDHSTRKKWCEEATVSQTHELDRPVQESVDAAKQQTPLVTVFSPMQVDPGTDLHLRKPGISIFYHSSPISEEESTNRKSTKPSEDAQGQFRYSTGEVITMSATHNRELSPSPSISTLKSENIVDKIPETLAQDDVGELPPRPTTSNTTPTNELSTENVCRQHCFTDTTDHLKRPTRLKKYEPLTYGAHDEEAASSDLDAYQGEPPADASRSSVNEHNDSLAYVYGIRLTLNEPPKHLQNVDNDSSIFKEVTTSYELTNNLSNVRINPYAITGEAIGQCPIAAISQHQPRLAAFLHDIKLFDSATKSSYAVKFTKLSSNSQRKQPILGACAIRKGIG